MASVDLGTRVDIKIVIASEAKQSRVAKQDWIASSLRSSQ
jgi:hypothetical protein